MSRDDDDDDYWISASYELILTESDTFSLCLFTGKNTTRMFT